MKRPGLARAVEIVEWWWGLRPFPPTRRLAITRVAVSTSAMVVAVVVLLSVTRPLRDALPSPVVPSEAADDLPMRFGVPLVERRMVFSELVGTEPEARKRGHDNFPGEPWSMEDDRAASERNAARDLAQARGISLSIVYAILDEGIRAKWPGKDGAPLEGRVVPLKPRRR